MASQFLGEMIGATAELTNESFRAVRKFRVRADSEAEALHTSGLPEGLEAHPWYPAARVRNLSADEEDPLVNTTIFRTWVVTVTYETPPDSEDPEEENENLDPTLDPPEVQLEDDEREELADGSFEDDDEFVKEKFTNSAGEPWDPPVTRLIAFQHFTITVNSYSATPFEIAKNYKNWINSEEFMGFAPHSVRFIGCKPISKSKNGVPYLQLTYVFKVKFPDWDFRGVDMGSYYLGASGNKINFKSATGDNYIGALNGSGGQGDEDNPSILPPKQLYPAKDFAGLGLPTSGYKYV